MKEQLNISVKYNEITNSLKARSIILI